MDVSKVEPSGSLQMNKTLSFILPDSPTGLLHHYQRILATTKHQLNKLHGISARRPARRIKETYNIIPLRIKLSGSHLKKQNTPTAKTNPPSPLLCTSISQIPNQDTNTDHNNAHLSPCLAKISLSSRHDDEEEEEEEEWKIHFKY